MKRSTGILLLALALSICSFTAQGLEICGKRSCVIKETPAPPPDGDWWDEPDDRVAQQRRREEKRRAEERLREQERQAGQLRRKQEREAERLRREMERQAAIGAEKERIANNLSVLNESLTDASKLRITPSTSSVVATPVDMDAVIARQDDLMKALVYAPDSFGVEVSEYFTLREQPTLMQQDQIVQADKERIKRGRLRRRAIIEKRLMTFDVADDPHVEARDEPKYVLHFMEEVRRNDANIERAAKAYGVDPDLVRSIIWQETTWGWGDFLKLGESKKTLRPMNVYITIWKGLGITRQGMQRPERNIQIGTLILKEIWTRLDNPTIEKAASLYIDLGTGRVNWYGRNIRRYYDEKPWTRVPAKDPRT